MNRYNDNENNTERELKRKTDGKDRTNDRETSPKEDVVDIERVEENGNGIITVNTGTSKDKKDAENIKEENMDWTESDETEENKTKEIDKRKTKNKQQNIKRLSVREEERLFGKENNMEDVRLLKRVQTDIKETAEGAEDWTDSKDTDGEAEEREQNETDKKKNEEE